MIRKYVLVLALGLSLAGCAGLDFSRSILTGGASVTASIQNPVTPRMLYDVENAATTALAGLVTYRRLCIAGKVEKSCRQTIWIIQGYTKPLQAALPQLRAFVLKNDQINAIKVFNEVRQLVGGIVAAKQAAGVQ